MAPCAQRSSPPKAAASASLRVHTAVPGYHSSALSTARVNPVVVPYSHILFTDGKDTTNTRAHDQTRTGNCSHCCSVLSFTARCLRLATRRYSSHLWILYSHPLLAPAVSCYFSALSTALYSRAIVFTPRVSCIHTRC